jgi:hypothetical protein
MKSAPGWWVAFGARLDVNSTPETAHESERIVLHFHGPRVHDGDPFSWELTTGMDHLGVRRLVLLDNATYPKPLLNVLQYHAIGSCRDLLLQRAAIHLGEQLTAPSGLRAVVSGVLAALGMLRGSARETQEREAAVATEYGDSYPYMRSRPPHVSLQPHGVSTIRILDETPRGVGGAGGGGGGGGGAGGSGGGTRTVAAAEAFALASSAAASSIGNTAEATGGSGYVGEAQQQQQQQQQGPDQSPRELPVAPLGVGISKIVDPFAEEESWSANAKAADGSGEGGMGRTSISTSLRPSHLPLRAASPTHGKRSEEEMVDSLRGHMPNRSTDTLRELVRAGSNY